jgi:uncharacterized protein (DUF433 family)
VLTLDDAILSHPEIQAGTPCFRGTRVPVRSLFDALLYGNTIEEFLQDFPTVQKAQVEAVLDNAHQLITRRQMTTPPHAA